LLFRVRHIRSGSLVEIQDKEVCLEREFYQIVGGNLMNLSSTKWTAIGPAPVDTPNVSLGHSAGRIEAAAPDPSNSDVMYVGANGGGVWKTGVWYNTPPTYICVGDGQPSLNFAGYHPLVVHPANKNLILGIVSGPGAGLLKSTNAGLGWTLLANSIFEGATLGSIAVHPTNPKVMYVSVWTGGAFAAPGVYKSTNGGAAWNNLTSFHNGSVSDVIIAKFNSKYLYAGMVSAVGTNGVYHSPDGGVTWKLMTGLPYSFFLADAVRLESSGRKGTVYATLFVNDLNGNTVVERYKTKDAGQTWKQLAATPGTPELRSWHVVLAVDPKDADHVFVNDAYKLFESTDSGQSWTSAENIGDDWVNMTFDANNNGVVTADRNLYTYEPKPKKWTAREGNLQVTQLYDITLYPKNINRAYGIAQDHVASMKFSGSIEWNFMSGGSGETGKILVDPANSNRLYASNPLAPADLVRRSTNGGGAWTTILTNNNFQSEDYALAYSVQKSFAMDPQNSKRLLIGLTSIFETTDATVANPSWSPFSGVLSPAANVSGQYITALAIAPSSSKIVYAATADGHVWTTNNNGQTWKQNDAGLFGQNAGKIVDMRIDPSNPKRVFAVTNAGAGKNIWYLNPSTTQWKAICGNMPTNLWMASICVEWKTPTILYAGTARGVYRSTDMGATWNVFGLDMPNTVVTDLQTLPASNILAAGTFGRGVWEILTAPHKGEPVPPKEAKVKAKKMPAARLKRATVTGAYFHVSELNMLPGQRPGQPLVRSDARARAKRERERNK
jgi:photosystem II stability/assembly factor-like uncharacterized protein